MALIKCSECSGSVSTDAKSCPKCGAKVKYRRPMSRGMKWALGFIGIGFIASIAFAPPREPRPALTPEQAAAEAAANAKAAELRAQESQENSERHQLTRLASDALKNSLRDPDSLQWISRHTNKLATLFCGKYRAKNGFGGYNTGIVIIDGGKPATDAKTWNKKCTKPGMYDTD